MWLERISIRFIIIAMLGGLGVVVMALSLFSTQKFRDASLEFQEQTLDRLIASAAQSELRALEKKAAEMGEFSLKDRSVAKLVKKAAGNDAEAKQQLQEHLKVQFNQRYITTGIVDVLILRLYDTKLNLMAQAVRNLPNPPENMHAALRETAISRKGANRMKRLGAIWVLNDRPLYSSLIPVGGLRLSGYLEVVANPIHELKDLYQTFNMPVRINSLKGTNLHQSEGWPEKPDKRWHTVTVPFPDSAGNPALQIQAVEDLTHLNGEISAIQWQILLAFAISVGIGILASLWILRKALFLPIRETVQTMERIANGDLTVQPKVQGLKELSAITRALNALVESIRSSVFDMVDISQQMLDQAHSLENVAGGTNKGITDLQDELTHIASAMNQMVATIEEVARNATSAAGAAGQADNEANQGRGVVAETVNVIEVLATKVESASAVISRLAEDSDNIGAVLDVIKGIAEQTNLLALNAAIEAARAGEQGRGFAVVADEVRTLASRTQQSTREIQEMIERLQGGAEEAVQAMEDSRGRAQACVDQAGKTGSSLETIVQAVSTINNMNTQIASAAEEHSAVASEINRNVSNISQVAEMSAEGARHTTSASEQLLQLSGQLRRQVERFKVES